MFDETAVTTFILTHGCVTVNGYWETTEALELLHSYNLVKVSCICAGKYKVYYPEEVLIPLSANYPFTYYDLPSFLKDNKLLYKEEELKCIQHFLFYRL